MGLTLATASRNTMISALAALMNGGTIQIRSGSRPASANDAATGSLLATVVLENPAFGSPSSGAVSLADPDAVTGAAAGTATWFRALDSSAAPVMDGAVSATGGGGDLQLATTSISVGLSVDITGGTLTQSAGSA